MAAGDPLPSTFPSMGALFKKPYMEFEFEGKMYRLEALAGGHNGRVAQACQSNAPVYDTELKRWVVRVENNLIDIDLSSQPEVAAAIAEEHAPLRKMTVLSSTRNSYKSTGLLVTETSSPDEQPKFPVDCIFNMHIRVKVPGRPALINVQPFQLRANGLEQWPPPVGTTYRHEDTVDLFPEWLPFAERFMQPIARIMPGDETVLTEVFPATAGPDTRNLFRRVVDRLT